MVIQTLTRVGMSLHDFLEAGEDQLFELIDGERIYKVANIFGHGYLIRWLTRYIEQYLANTEDELFNELTYTVNDSSDWVKGSRIPDLMFYSAGRLQSYRAANPRWMYEPLRLVPDLTIEIVSPTERFTDIEKKIAADLANGVQIVWTIDLTSFGAQVHTVAGIQRVPADGALSADALLPGFVLSLKQLSEQFTD